MNGRRWTQNEVDFLENHLYCTNKFLAEKLGRTVIAIKNKKSVLSMRNYHVPAIPEPLTQQEKEIRILKLAADMRVKLKGWCDV